MNTKKISIIQRIKEKFLGKQFFIAVIANKGTSSYFVNSTIYRSEKEVKAYIPVLAIMMNLPEEP